jgi:Leu/Phe-tRNA-protein transferase
MHEGYTLKDVLKPDRLRVQKALSGIINLQKFKESVQDEYNEHIQRSVRADQQRWRWGSDC